MSNTLYRIGRFGARSPWKVIGVWAVLAITVIAASAMFGRELEDSFDAPGVDSAVAAELLESAGAADAGVTAQVVVTPADGSAITDATSAADLALVEDELAAIDDVVGVGTAISPDARVALLTVQYPVLEELSAADLEELKVVLDDARAATGLQVEAGGELFFSFEEASSGSELIGIVAAMVILLVAFGSVVAMGLPIGMALFGLALGVASMGLVTYLIEIPSWAPQMATMIGLGVGIDYALMLVTRHREFLGQGLAIDEAAGQAVATAGGAVVFAGGTVVIAILGLAVAGLPFMTAAAVATSVIVALMVLASITILPAFLGLAGERVNGLRATRRSGRAQRDVARHTESERWAAWADHVARHAKAYTIGITAGLLALTAPVLALELGYPDDGTLPESQTQRRAYDLVADSFGAGANGPLVIAVDLTGGAAGIRTGDATVDSTGDVTGSGGATGSAADRDVVDALATAIERDAGVAAVTGVHVDSDAGVASIIAIPTTAPQDDATFATVQRLRSEVFPAALGDSSVSAHVGGATATFGDVANRVSERLVWFIGAVVLLSFVLLTVVFRAVVVALKAAVLNLLSIGAAYGVLVAVFQWGWGRELIGLESTVPIVSFIPMFMFAVLFGLSMDYEVFLLSRVREEYDATGDNHAAVTRGLAGTGRVITSAALIMISVFAGFVLADDPMTKMLGLGMATAIFVDATIVRVILVPATMTLMGRANWWAPQWLPSRRLHVPSAA